jgi:hypothetical protein
MARTVTTTIDRDVLRVEVAGERPADDEEALGELRHTWRRVAELCAERRITRVLAVLQLAGPNNSVRAFSMSSSLEAIGLSRDVRVALVDRDPQSLPHSLFAARVASSRGWQIGAFACEVEAARWLAAG